MAIQFNMPTSAAVALAGALVLGGGSTAAYAFGALAVGETASVAQDGIATGASWDATSTEEANRVALGQCRSAKKRPLAAEHCRVIATFHNECYAISFDPKPGTPGAGWGIGADQATAQERALAHCRLTAGNDRDQFCVVSDTHCDTK